MNHQTIRDHKECIVNILQCVLPVRVLKMIEAPVSKTQLQAHIRATNSTKAVLISYVTKEDLTVLQKSLQKQILKNRNSIIIILPS
jgi:type IV secretory pathway ATPase VirB11/archaellum biosynthesis ATPase